MGADYYYDYKKQQYSNQHYLDVHCRAAADTASISYSGCSDLAAEYHTLNRQVAWAVIWHSPSGQLSFLPSAGREMSTSLRQYGSNCPLSGGYNYDSNAVRPPFD